MKISALILAAGKSSRMGDNKQLLPLKKSTILRSVIENALDTQAKEVCVVLGADADLIKKNIQDLPVKVVLNKNYEKGLSSSIIAGMEHVNEADAVLIILGDQPLISSNYWDYIISASKNHPLKIMASNYGGFKGVPALFPKKYFKELFKLKGDSGAKQLLNSIQDKVITINSPVDLSDIDTPEDYNKLIRNIE